VLPQLNAAGAPDDAAPSGIARRLCCVIPVTSVPSRTREVSRANPAKSVHASSPFEEDYEPSIGVVQDPAQGVSGPRRCEGASRW
jgi:hypothetical protein